jgi:single-strand DNA-binding protein
MASMNKVFLMGNLTRDPALRFTPGGAAVCEFGIAMNRRFTSNGQDKEETCFVDIVVWGKQAESCDRFLEKGSPVLVEGRLQYDQWEDRDGGGKRSRLRVVAERVQFMGRSGGDSGGQSQQQDNSQNYNQNYNRQNQQGNYSQQNNQQYSQQNNSSRQNSYNQGNNAPQGRPQPPQQQQREEFPPPPPPMPEDAFKVEDEMEDDIPF